MSTRALPLAAAESDAAPATAANAARARDAGESPYFPGHPARGERAWVPFATVVAVWMLLGAYQNARGYVSSLLFGQAMPSPKYLVTWFVVASGWVVVTLLVFRLCGSVLRGRPVWVRALVHVTLGCSVSLLMVFVHVRFDTFFFPDEPKPEFSIYFRSAFFWFNQWYAALVGAWHMLDYHARWRAREVQAARLGTQLAQAQLEALKMQIQPHFLFNSLHTISELVHEDPDAADRMVARLGDLLRLTVDNAAMHEVTLAREMDFLRAYLDIQQHRFQDCLTVTIDVAPDTLDALVPNLALQPLVENAIKHGVEPMGGAGEITVTAARRGDRLELVVRDNGRGLPPVRPAGGREGVGVRNTRARLEQLYGPTHTFEVKNDERGGVVARVELPFRTAASAAAGAVR